MQGEYLITVLITNYNTLDFVKLSLYSLEKLTKNNYKVLINDNGSEPKDIDGLKRIALENENVFVNFRKSKNKEASFAHAEALDVLINIVDTKYTAVLDSDCTFLIKNWDELLIGMLDDKVKIAGSALAKGRNGLKPDDFPLQFSVLFDTRIYKQLNISCKPRDISKGEDTCWEWKPKFINAGYRGAVLNTRCTRDFKKGPFKSITGVEEYYANDGKLVAVHFGRGSSTGAGKTRGGNIYKIAFISQFIRKYIGLKEKKKWIKISRKIIAQQM